jgi:hypothetical protein
MWLEPGKLVRGGGEEREVGVRVCVRGRWAGVRPFGLCWPCSQGRSFLHLEMKENV